MISCQRNEITGRYSVPVELQSRLWVVTVCTALHPQLGQQVCPPTHHHCPCRRRQHQCNAADQPKACYTKRLVLQRSAMLHVLTQAEQQNKQHSTTANTCEHMRATAPAEHSKHEGNAPVVCQQVHLYRDCQAQPARQPGPSDEGVCC